MNFRISMAVGSVLVGALTLVGCGGGSSYSNPAAPTPIQTSTPASNPADVTITITGSSGALSYSPSPATVKAGQTVAWRNGDGIAHTATADAAGGFNTGTLGPGATSAPIMMATAGTFSYHCAIHGSMTGTLIVTP